MRFLLICFFFFSIQLCAQSFSISGRVIDGYDSSSLIGVSVFVTKNADSSVKNGVVTDGDGKFIITGLTQGKYTLSLVYLGYKRKTNQIVLSENTDLGVIRMKSETKLLKETVVKGKQIRAEQLGDTTQFHADAFKTHTDASAEDLVAKMPGVTSDNKGVKVNGESVQQVYVDGKPFFGNDPTLALRNLPSEVIDKIQVFDKLSDQATFTGFDDGNAQKTMNITTKKNKSEGVFGKVYSGYGTDDRFIFGGNLNVFDGDRRISILGLSNNINQQNFSAQDLLGVTGSGSGQNRGGGMGGGGGRGNFGGGAGGGASTNNFLVGQQGGITTTNSVGINYSDNWGKKVKVMGSYFFNATDNTNQTDITRNYFTTGDSANVYHEYDTAETKNYNHRFNLRLEYTIDSFNTVIFTPAISFQQNSAASKTNADDSLGGNLSSSTLNSSTADNNGYSSTNNLLFQHKFKRQRRTISVNINNSINQKTGTGTYFSYNEFSGTALPTLFNQNSTFNNYGYTLVTNINYTEPVGKKGQIMANYSPSYSMNTSDKETYSFNSQTGKYDLFDTLYSNKYNNTYVTQRGGLSYRLGDKKLNFMVGANYQSATLEGEQSFPYSLKVPRTFSDVLPTAMFNYRFEDGRNLRIMYRTNTVAPSVTQLQDVVDISNPLLLKGGNPNLKQDYEQTVLLRYGQTKSKSAHNFFVYLFGNYINNYIGNATYQPMLRDSLFKGPFMHNPITINKGSQLTLPVNLNGYFNERAFVTYGIPVQFIKCNFNLNGGFNYTRTPGQVNNLLNYSYNSAPTFGAVLSSNISEKLDFTLSYTGNYNFVTNSIQSQGNNNYYSDIKAFKINWVFLKNFVFNTNITHNYYAAFSSTGNQEYFLWTTYLGYKMLKKQALEARITCYDMLNQNKSISRTVTETYIENSITKVLKQYFIFQLTYTIRNFKGTLPISDAPRGDREHGDFGNRPWGEGHR